MRIFTDIRDQLHGFKAVSDLNRERVLEPRRDIAKKREPRELSSMTPDIFDTPCEIGSVPVSDREHWLDQWVGTADAGVQQCEITDVIPYRPRSSLSQVLYPDSLLLDSETIKVVCRNRWGGQGPNLSQMSHG